MDTFSAGSAIRRGWEVFKKRPLFIIGTLILIWVASWFGAVISGVIQAFISTNSPVAAAVTGFALMVIVQILANIGYLAFLLKVYDNPETARVSDAWRPGLFVNFVITMVLMYIIIMLGFVLLIVPGVIASVALIFAPYLVVDKGLGPIAAIKESMRITKGSRVRLFALFMACSLVMLLGVLALFVGILAALPVSMLALVAAYRWLSSAPAETPRKPLSWGEIFLVSLVGLLIPLGIFSSIVLASLDAAREKGREAANAAHMKMLQLSLEIYYDAHSQYPENLADALESAGKLDYPPNVDDFTYTVESGGTEYQLCAKNPLPDGVEACATSFLDASSTQADEPQS